MADPFDEIDDILQGAIDRDAAAAKQRLDRSREDDAVRSTARAFLDDHVRAMVQAAAERVNGKGAGMSATVQVTDDAVHLSVRYGPDDHELTFASTSKGVTVGRVVHGKPGETTRTIDVLSPDWAKSTILEFLRAVAAAQPRRASQDW